MGVLKAIWLRLGVVWALLAVPLAAQSALFLEGPTDWYRGDLITVELKTDQDIVVNSFFFDALYGPFASVLQIGNDPRLTLPAFISPDAACNRDGFGDICSYYSSSAGGQFAPQGSLAKWIFRVKEDAPLGVVGFDFDLNIEVATGSAILSEQVDWPASTQFQVLQAIPEPSSWILMLGGLAAVGVCAARRRMAL